jgi:hypothetical protein
VGANGVGHVGRYWVNMRHVFDLTFESIHLLPLPMVTVGNGLYTWILSGLKQVLLNRNGGEFNQDKTSGRFSVS